MKVYDEKYIKPKVKAFNGVTDKVLSLDKMPKKVFITFALQQ